MAHLHEVIVPRRKIITDIEISLKTYVFKHVFRWYANSLIRCPSNNNLNGCEFKMNVSMTLDFFAKFGIMRWRTRTIRSTDAKRKTQNL